VQNKITIMKLKACLLLVCLLSLGLLLAVYLWAEPQSSPFELVIVNGHIIDGTGSPWYSGDVGIREGKIAGIGNLKAAPRTRTIDARGMVVAPGFIDMLGQSELTILVDPRLPSKIYQGITAEITGEGGSAAPLSDAIIQADGAPALRTTTSLPTGERFSSISPIWKNKAWELISPAM
jgi:dihydroorotase/N-acyl-D-amino-acid deacylase